MLFYFIVNFDFFVWKFMQLNSYLMLTKPDCITNIYERKNKITITRLHQQVKQEHKTK